MATVSELVHLVDRILIDKVIMQHEWDLLIDLIHVDGKITEEERAQLTRIQKLVASGEIEIKNTQRDTSRRKH